MLLGQLLIERLTSWPVVTLVILLTLRKPLITLLSRVQSLKAGKEGFALDASIVAASIQSSAVIKDSQAEQRLRTVKNIAVSPSVVAREERIRADLQTLKLEPNQATVDLLVQQLAVIQAVAAAEMIYRTIFGSQIALLKNMNITPGTVPRQVLEAVYDAAKLRFPDVYGTYSFQQWVNYLAENGLIQTNDQLQFSISVDGQEFLKWMTTAKVREDKPF